MNTTNNLRLNLPEGTDWADVAKLNENFEKLDAAVAAAQSADGYDESRSYAVGDYCLHDGTLYRCTTATAGEAWNAAHWAATTLAAELTRHVANTVSHVTAAERTAWNAKANAVHAARHASGGADPITPASIGAAAASHTHTPASIGAAAAKHTHTPASIGAAAAWKLIAQYKTAGSYTWTVPTGVTQIGVYMVGGGGSGARGSEGSSQTYYPTGGAAGYGKNIELTVTPGRKIAVVVGAGGAGTTGKNGANGNAGGTTAFNGVTVLGGAGGTKAGTHTDGADGGQGSDPNPGFRAATVPMYGSCPTRNIPTCHGGLSQSPRESQNRFDPGMVTLCAGGAHTQTVMAMPDGTKGGDGASGKDCVAGSATGNGNGGGASFVGNLTDSTTSGSGSPGMILIYAKAV